MAQTRASQPPWSMAARDSAVLAVKELVGFFFESAAHTDHCIVSLLGMIARSGCKEVRCMVGSIVPSILQSMLDGALSPIVAEEAWTLIAACHHVLELAERQAWVGLAVELLLRAAREQEMVVVVPAVHMLELLCGDITPAEARACFHKDIVKLDALVKTAFGRNGARFRAFPMISQFLDWYT